MYRGAWPRAVPRGDCLRALRGVGGAGAMGRVPRRTWRGPTGWMVTVADRDRGRRSKAAPGLHGRVAAPVASVGPTSPTPRSPRPSGARRVHRSVEYRLNPLVAEALPGRRVRDVDLGGLSMWP